MLAALPRVLEELYGALEGCLEAYTTAFGAGTADIECEPPTIHISVRDNRGGRWEQRARIEITTDAAIPGFRVDHDGEQSQVEIGLLPGDKVFYKKVDEFLTLDELTRRILDRALFPRLVA